MPTVTQRMLTQHLRALEADGLISRTVHPVVPPHVDYDLTDLSRMLLPILDAMAIWGNSPEVRALGSDGSEISTPPAAA